MAAKLRCSAVVAPLSGEKMVECTHGDVFDGHGWATVHQGVVC